MIWLTMIALFEALADTIDSRYAVAQLERLFHYRSHVACGADECIVHLKWMDAGNGLHRCRR